MSIRSLADFNGDVPWVGPVLARTDTVTAQGTPTADHINAGTFAGHTRGLSHGQGQELRRAIAALREGQPLRRRRTVTMMPASELGPWKPLGIESVVATFTAAPFRWWVSGGYALDLHLGRTWRDHEDIDVGVVRSDLRALHAFLPQWDLHVAAAGQLTRWRGEPLEVARQQNNVWCRLTADGPWVLDVTISEGSGDNWIYRRDPTIHVPWSTAVLRTVHGIPYLAPELQLLYKSKGMRSKDDIDAAEVIPSLDARRRDLLSRLLDSNHPWQRRLA